MIQLTFKIHDLTLFRSVDDILPIAQHLISYIDEHPLTTLPHKLELGLQSRDDQFNGQFIINLQGVALIDEVATSIFARKLSEILREIGLDKMIHMSRLTCTLEESDMSFDRCLLDNPITRNSRLLSKYKLEDTLPDHYQCALSSQIMDNPVYLKDNQRIRYEKSVLTRWLYGQKENFHDPFTREPIHLGDIREDHVLKSEINDVIQKKIIKSMIDKHVVKPTREKIIEVLTKCKAYDGLNITTTNMEKALRNAAAKGQADNLRILLTCDCNIDAADAGPKKRTAFHWAIINGQVECATLLLKAGANHHIEDGEEKKTPAQYAKASTNNDIRYLFGFAPIEARNEVNHIMNNQ